MKIEGGTHFLVLSGHGDDLKVESHAAFRDVISSADEGLRVSPIFPLDNAPTPKFKKANVSRLVFYGPLYPGELNYELDIPTYLTLGTYNIVSWCLSDEEYDSVIEFLNFVDSSYEVWDLSANKVNERTISIKNSNGLSKKLRAPMSLADELKISSREYALLMFKLVSEAEKFWPSHAEELVAFDQGFKKVIEDEPDDLGRLTHFVTTNSSLSKLLSQAYAGCSPIVHAECPYTNNSLLGIGLANQVLSSLYNFSSGVFYKAKLIQRIQAMKVVPQCASPIYGLAASDNFFDENNLYHEDVNAQLEKMKEESDVPNVTCFSGRDGFRATKFSLSAPLEVISGANTFEWTLMTLTHEISHILIGGVLGEFFPAPREQVDRRLALLSEGKAKNLYERAEELLLFAFMLLHRESRASLFDCQTLKEYSDREPDVQKSISKRELIDFIVEGSPEANEVLTHIFDFRYFYRADIELYIKSVWSSWAVVPNIEGRIPKYLIRTICAIYASRTDWSVDESIDALDHHLGILIDETTTAHDQPNILIEAKADLLHRRDIYKKALSNRGPLVKFVNAFLYSPKIAKKLTSESVPAASSLGFRRDRITNPLRFLEDHAKDHKPMMLKSLWMLQNLAFSKISDR